MENCMIVTLEEGATAKEIKKALLMIRGVASVRATSAHHTVTPALRRRISQARTEKARGETIVCHTPEEMQHYFDTL